MVIAMPLVQLQQGPASVLGLAALALCLVSQAASAQAPKPPVAAQANSTFGYQVKDG